MSIEIELPPTTTATLLQCPFAWKAIKLETPVCYDIETGPLPLPTLKQIYTPLPDDKLPKKPEPFDEGKVKLGQRVKREAIVAKIEQDRAKHAREEEEWEYQCGKAQRDHWEAFVEKAPLNAATGQVLAIGLGTGGQKYIMHGEETALIAQFWSLFDLCVPHLFLAGYYSRQFDLPFLIRRSWILDIHIPVDVIYDGRRKYFNDTFVDLFDVWSCGAYGERVGLETISAAMGGPKKPSNVKADTFWKEWLNGDRDEAAAYLENDIAMTELLATKLRPNWE